MYLSTVWRGSGSSGLRAAIAGNVLALGLVSLVTDISSEMVTAILPAYLVLGLHLTVLEYGVVDGLYTGFTALTRLAGGYLADRLRARKLVAGIGYAVSTLAKLGMLAAGRSVAGITGAIGADRVGKGLRTAPRDALITLSVPADMLGRAFGVHRMMDTLGAFAGPLLALAVLAMTAPDAYDAVFVVSFCAGALGVTLLVLMVREQTGDTARRAHPRFREGLRLLATPEFRRLQLAAVLLGTVTVGDGFVYLSLQQREDLHVLWFPLLAVGTNLAYLLLATPFGALADRFGRWKLVVAGHLALAVVYLLMGAGPNGWLVLVATLALYGTFYAATDGVLMAAAGPVLPEQLRTTGIALLQTGQALAYLLSSIGFGAAWQVWGPRTAALLAFAGVLVALPLSARWLHGASVAR